MAIRPSPSKKGSPKYKPGQDAEARKKAKNSNLPISNPDSGIGVRTPSGGYAAPGVEVYEGSKATGATKIVSSGKGNYQSREGESGSIMTASGEEVKVTAQKESSFKETKEARVQELKKADSLNAKQQKELQAAIAREQPKKIAVDAQAVDAYNQQLKNEGIKDAKTYFEAVRGEQANSAEESVSPPKTLLDSSPKTFAPRTTSLSESSQPLSEETQSRPIKPTYGGVISADKPEYRQQQNQTGLQKTADILSFRFVDEAQSNFANFAETPGNEPSKLLVVPINVAYGVFSGVRDTAIGTYEIVQEARKVKGAKEGLFFASDTFNSVASATVDQAGAAGTAFIEGDIPELGKQAGYFYGQGKAGELVANPVAKPAAKAYADIVNLPENIKAAERAIKFEEAKVTTYNSKTGQYELNYDPDYTFSVNEYDITGRKRVFVPKDISEPTLGLAGQRANPDFPSLKAQELQAQLYAKQIPEDRSIFAPETYKPQSLSEVAKKEPSLAKELASENGQTVFSPNQPSSAERSLTPDEILMVAKEQAGAKPQELQKTLPGFLPTKQEYIILRNNEAVAVKESNTIIIKDKPFLGNKKGQIQYNAGLGVNSELIEVAGEAALKGAKGIFDKFKRESDILDSDSSTGSTNSKVPPIIIIKSKPDNIIIREEKPGVLGRINQKDKSNNKALPIADIGRESIIDVSTGQKPKSKGKSKSNLAQAQSSIQESSQESIQITQQVQIASSDFAQPQQTRQKTKQKNKSQDVPDIFKAKPKKQSQLRKKSESFEVEIREKGIFTTKKSTKSKKEAQALAELDVRNTAAASFRIKQGGDVITDLAPSRDFSRSKREKGVLIQNREDRISTSGEKKEITFKGIFASKAKKKKFGIF